MMIVKPVHKRYGFREAYDMPRSLSERFESNAVSKLAKNSLNEGIHLVNIGKKSTFVKFSIILLIVI